MVSRIDLDLNRFKKMIRGSLKKGLRKYMSQGELLGKQKGGVVSIPIPRIDIPHFTYGSKGTGGASQGDGDIGTSLGPPDQSNGSSGAGTGGGAHGREVEVELDELAMVLMEELQLPPLLPKKEGELNEHKNQYRGIRRVGPESLRNFRRMFLEGLKRQIIEGTYDPENPRIDFVKEDKRYRSPKQKPNPKTQALAIYMMDVSGSMYDSMKEIVRTEAWWIDLWINHCYKGFEKVFIIHDDNAKVVDADEFYHTNANGGTKISTAFTLANFITDGKIEVNGRTYRISDWNMYGFYFGDGDNYSSDNAIAVTELKELAKKLNLLGYFQVGNSSGQTFIDEIEGAKDSRLKDDVITEKVRTTRTPEKDKIMDSIRAVFQAKNALANS